MAYSATDSCGIIDGDRGYGLRGSVLLVGEPVLRRREAQRVETHAHRHAGVADRPLALVILVHSKYYIGHERKRTRFLSR